MVMAKKTEPSNTSGPAAGEGVTRGRPGRRTMEERSQAVLELLSGRSSVDQLAKRYGVLPATVAGWKEQALAGIETALRQGDGGSPRERELERKVEGLEDALRDVSVKYALAQRGVEEWKATARPTPRGRSRR